MRVRLRDLGVITARGPDAAAFLNGQLTVDVPGIGPDRWQLGAYCSPKGRVIAVVEAWREGDAVHLLLPVDRIEPLLSRLARFILRAKVRLEDQSAQWIVWGLTGRGTEQALRTAGFDGVATTWACASTPEGGRLARAPASPSTGARFVLVAPAHTASIWPERLASLAEVESGVWWWSKIDAGLPDVFKATEERFVPQMLNLDVLGGVHFQKGCYPGQEVVARSQYLGKLRRRMACAHAVRAHAGQDVVDEAHDAAPVGTVVMAASAPGGGMDLLLECPAEQLPGGRLRLAGASTPALTLGALPYPIVNPTA